ncbi:ALKBH6 [Lepeophtheirus salmonis]|uniref:ALKBH6 n=1 Tax=Lepeophtheirus salmonis TaxID=72036 RepID=A0A7R8HBI9_LEPSM|nr:ALKBH6 [Lepeophtheirus salmonis]CAF2973597.1 ALKBH6 [Lepeophtheirus salmonis]
MLDICDYKVPNAPKNLYYIPEFITPSVEKYLLNQIYRTPKVKWTQLMNRRLQNWGGVPQKKGMIPEDVPDWLSDVVRQVNLIPKVFESTKSANHVLLNEYLPGVGIMPHLDGDMYYPTITTVSLGSSTIFRLLYSNRKRCRCGYQQ